MTAERSWVIQHGGHEAVIGRRGGGVQSYSVDGVPVLDAIVADEVPEAYHGLVLAPWPNRIPGGRWVWEGRQQQLAITEVARDSALHGLVAFAAWTPVSVTAEAVELAVGVEPQPGYPFALDLAVTWSVDDHGLTCRMSARNTGASAAPFGAAVHPYVVLPGGGVDELSLTLPAASWLETDDSLRPLALRPVQDTDRDYRSGAALRGKSLDTAFTDMTGDRVLVSDGSTGVEVWADAAFGWWQVYTSDYFPPDSPRFRRAVAIEAMTCGPNAFNTGQDLIVLTPGARWDASWGVRPAA